MVIFFTIFFTLYTIINSYILLRSWQAISHIPLLRILYPIIFVIAAISYILAKIFSDKLPDSIYTVLIWIGSFWFMFLFYLFLLFLGIDLIKLFNRFIHFFTVEFQNDQRFKFYSVLIVYSITILFSIYGYFNRLNIKVKELDINLNSSINKTYHIVFFSDLHISVVNNHSFLKSVVEKINSFDPDLILIGGDLVDEKASKLQKSHLADELMNLRSRFGVYSITGNHEFINEVNSTTKFLESLGIKFLRDEYVLIDSSLYVIGREDLSSRNFTDYRRKSLDELIQSINNSLPKILLDHQPLNFQEAVLHRIDLQLSGHTHHGQIAPANLITKLVYEISWGYKQKGKTHFYVSSGIGTWGPPIKIGNDAEIVLINLKM